MEVSNYKDEVWKKASVVDGYDEALFRKDAAGAWISYSEFGNRNSKFGWEIDHIYPVSKGGGDELVNLRAMQWENNVSKGDDFPVYIAEVTADGSRNINKEIQRRINNNVVNSLRLIYHID